MTATALEHWCRSRPSGYGWRAPPLWDSPVRSPCRPSPAHRPRAGTGRLLGHQRPGARRRGSRGRRRVFPQREAEGARVSGPFACNPIAEHLVIVCRLALVLNNELHFHLILQGPDVTRLPPASPRPHLLRGQLPMGAGMLGPVHEVLRRQRLLSDACRPEPRSATVVERGRLSVVPGGRAQGRVRVRRVREHGGIDTHERRAGRSIGYRTSMTERLARQTFGSPVRAGCAVGQRHGSSVLHHLDERLPRFLLFLFHWGLAFQRVGVLCSRGRSSSWALLLCQGREALGAHALPRGRARRFPVDHRAHGFRIRGVLKLSPRDTVGPIARNAADARERGIRQGHLGLLHVAPHGGRFHVHEAGLVARAP
eukprot:scaffold301_cov243-Pinguiococcus_pyrenoidosus.AAC.38